MRLNAPTLLCCALIALAGAAPPAAAAQTSDAELQVQVAEARRQFEALEYEQAIPALDRVVALLQDRAGDDTRRLLAGALEMRARSKFGTGDQDGAREDFATLLKADPSYTLADQVSPRVVALFEEVQASMLTSLALNVTPPTAAVLLDGVRVASTGTVRILVGEHTLEASQVGYAPGTLSFTATPDMTAEATLALARSSAVLSLVSSPADVEVLVDGVSRGRTAAGPPPAEFAERAARAGIAANELSAVFTVTDLATGAHRIEFRRPCFVQAERRQEISQLDDYVLDPVKLEPAVAALRVSSTQPDASVLVDGESRGRAPYTTDLCEGPHTIEMRGATGRFVRKVDARPGQTIDVTGTLRPAFALVSSTQTSLNTDLRGAIERALEPLQSILVFAPPAEALAEALRAQKLPPDWLGYDANRRPVGVSAEVTSAMRRELTGTLSAAFGAQGVAAVTAPTATRRSHVVLTLLATGVAEPDVIDLDLDVPQSVADAVARLDRTVPVTAPTIGLFAIDVADSPGPVVIGVDANGPAAAAGIRAGDIVVSADGKPVADAAALQAAVGTRTSAGRIAIELARGGAQQQAEVAVLMRPRLLSIDDRTLLVNRALVALRARLAEAGDPEEEAAVRLNLAAALARLESWSEARAELQKVTLGDGPGVGTGTVQYLLGLCAARLGNRAEAEAAFTQAAASNSLLNEDGPPVRELAEARLAELQRPR